MRKRNGEIGAFENAYIMVQSAVSSSHTNAAVVSQN